jgi:hypothetical protein
MVQGLFPRHEQACVLDMLERSVVFLTPVTIDQVLEQSRWLSTAWDLANLFLAGVKAEILSDDAPYLVGLSEETTCYLSAAYFDASGRFDDFLVHEVAHIFHNCKRQTIGLRETRSVRAAWRSTRQSARPSPMPARLTAATPVGHVARSTTECCEYVQGQCRHTKGDVAEYLDNLGEAVVARNGWKRHPVALRAAPTAQSEMPQ